MLFELKILMNEKGEAQVTGPLDNPALCYGMLEVAKDVIRDLNKKKDNRIEVPMMSLANRD